MIIDAQVHAWLPDTPERPWAAGGAARAQLPSALDYNTLLGMMDDAGVDGVVIVPPSWEGDRNDHALDGAARHPKRIAVMGRLPLNDRKNAERLPGWKSRPGMLGIRQTFVLEQERARMTDGTADWFWDGAEAAGIPVMLHATGFMKEVGLIAERHPRLTLIIDHFGLSARMAKEGRIKETIESTASLAKHQNVYVKVSAAPVYSSEGYPFRDMDPHIRRIVDAYGPRRCFWGTDLSHATGKGKGTYRQFVTHFTEELSFLSSEDKEWIMGRALAECLGWKM